MTITTESSSAAPAGSKAPLLQLRGVNKSFGAVDVLRGVDLDVTPGQVTALVGDNGAGKSTLIKGIAGIHQFDSGEYRYDGNVVHVTSPKDSNALGIEVVYQDLALCDNLDVVQNMYLGREQKKTGLLDEDTMEAKAKETLSGLSVRTLKSVRTQVSSLSGGQRQTVAIARAVLWNSRVVILDEPTAALGVAQTEQVLLLVRRLADRGLAVVLISHNLVDVFEVADNIAVLYLGQMVAQVDAKSVNNNQVVELITAGRSGDLGLKNADATAPSETSSVIDEGSPGVSTETPTRPSGFEAAPGTQSLGDAARAYLTKIRGGDVGSLPAVGGLIALVIVFSALRPSTFTTAFNFANLINQSAGVIVIAMGLIFVLLLGEIDLGAGFTAGVCASITGITMTKHGWPWPLALLAAVVVGVVIGTCIGWLVSYLGIPSFVVTLATYLGFQGVQLVLIGEGGTIAYRNTTVLAIMNKNMPIWLGWAIFIVGMGAYAALTFRRSVARRKAGLVGDVLSVWAFKTLVMVVVLGAATAYLSKERSKNPDIVSLKGVPIVVAVLVALLLVLTFVLNRTTWGRHVYAIGGNAEAARRAGINVPVVKLTCFVMSSSLAAVAGILIASRDNSVSPQTGGNTTLLYAVGAAVIGGCSLFGGKGKIVHAIIGGLVVAVIDNGMSLLNQSAGRVFMVTGLVLLIAASVDALSRRRATASGRA